MSTAIFGSALRQRTWLLRKSSITQLRMNHSAPLLEDSAPKEPMVLLNRWIDDAKREQLPLPTVASLASSSLPSGRVSSRMVNIKEVNSSGSLVVYSDFAESKKGRDIATNSQVALTFYWQQLDRSVRVEGTLKLLSSEESKPYFKSRGRDFQASVLVGPQTQPVEGGRDVLTARIKQIIDSGNELEIPEFWKGAEISPDWIEFWQGNADRISDRLSYTLESGHWTLQRLSP